MSSYSNLHAGSFILISGIQASIYLWQVFLKSQLLLEGMLNGFITSLTNVKYYSFTNVFILVLSLLFKFIYTHRLQGKVALITGGASGIGESTARLFSRHGAKVVIADIQDNLGLSVCKDLSPTSASFVHCDVTNEKEVENAVNLAVATHGKLDIMFNNAGIAGEAKPHILDNDKTEFERVLNVNVVGAFLGTKHAARVMIPGT